MAHETPRNYAVDEEIAAFFCKTTATQVECEARARQLTSSDRIEAVAIQGVCSYTLYAGDNLEYVVQCRYKSLALNMETCRLATEIHGKLVPTVTYHSSLGSDGDDDKEPLLVYLMSRMPGITQLDFVLESCFLQEEEAFFPLRQNFIGDIACFFAKTWLAPQNVSEIYRDSLRQSYMRDLKVLRGAFPGTLSPIIADCVTSIDDIMSLPMVLVHRDFGCCNMLVNETTCHLQGVVDWAEAAISPFGLNLHSLLAFMGKMYLERGWEKFPDYDALQNTFWKVFLQEVGGLPDETVKVIKKARVLGMLLSHGFTCRLANENKPVPLKDDAHGRENMRYLDAFLVNDETKVDS